MSPVRPGHLRTGTVLTAAGAVAALAAGLLAAAPPAAAASGAWSPSRYGAFLAPSEAMDGVLSVSDIGPDTKGVLKTFTPATGAAVSLTTTFTNLQDYAWSPAGDALLYGPSHNGDSSFVGYDLTTPNPRPFADRAVSSPAQWSPSGDSYVQDTAGPAPIATWVTKAGQQTFKTLPPAPLDPAVVTPGRNGLVFTSRASDGAPRDLYVQDHPKASNAAASDEVFPVTAAQDLALLPNRSTALGYTSLDAHDPAVSASGVLAFVGTDTDAGTADEGVGLYVDEGTGATRVADLTAACSGQRPAFSASGSVLAYVAPASGGCDGGTELRTITRTAGTFVGGATHLVSTAAADHTFEAPSWRATAPQASSVRFGGADRVATSIATSQGFYGDHQAHTVVLVNSANFPDAVSATPLAGASGGPMLLNPAGKLDSRVRAEIQRVLAPTGYVYVVGGTAMISDTVAQSVANLGFDVYRLAGRDRFATSVEVARELDWGFTDVDVTRRSAFLADGMQFPDALVAGPAAATYLAPVLLTNGTKMPAAVAAYLANTQDHDAITRIYGIGGQAAASRAGITKVVGTDRFDTAAKVASRFFPGAGVVGYASGLVFPDALSGSAALASLGQPLLLVGKGAALPAATKTAAYAQRAATDYVVGFGGTAWLKDTQLNEGTVQAGDVTPLSAAYDEQASARRQTASARHRALLHSLGRAAASAEFAGR